MNQEYPESITCIPLEDIEEALFTSRKGEKYWILRNSLHNTYIRLTEAEHAIWCIIKEGDLENRLICNIHKKFPLYSFEKIFQLILSLQNDGFIRAQESDKNKKTSGEGSDSWISHYWELLIPLSGMNTLFDKIDSSVGWIIRSKLFPWFFSIFCLCGLSYFIITEPLPSYPILLGDDSQLVTVISIYLILITAAVLHVFGHALACKMYGRKIGDTGILLYYGMPGLYIDTSDIWMADRRSRVIVSLAGPAVNVFIGSFCALLVLAFPDGDYSLILWRVAFLSFAVALINVNPLLEFDGYYALADLLEVHDLRVRAFSYIRSVFSGHSPKGKEGWFFFIYGTASALFTFTIVIIGIYFWQEHMTDLLNELHKDSWEVDHILATFAIIIVFVPFFAGMIISAIQTIIKKCRKGKNIQEGGFSDGSGKNDEIGKEMILMRRISK